MSMIIRNFLKFSIKHSGYFNSSSIRNISLLNARLHCNAKPENEEILPARPRVQPDLECHKHDMDLPPDCPEDARLLKVAIIGVPNSGKSTLTNQLVNAPVCDVSKKVHTTTHSTSTVLVHKNVQVVFLDTPGMITLKNAQKYHLEPSIISDPLRSLKEADLFLVVADMNVASQRLELPYIIGDTLNNFSQKQSILVLNKIDKIKGKRKLLETINNLTIGKVGGHVAYKDRPSLTTHLNSHKSIEDFLARKQKEKQLEKIKKKEEMAMSLRERITAWPNFSHVFMVSAVENDGVDDLRSYLLGQALPAHWAHHSSILTTMAPQALVKMTVRAKFLNCLQRNLPYDLKYRITDWRFTANNVLTVSMEVICPSQSIIKFVVGRNGERVQGISYQASKVLANLFKCPVDLNILVK